MKIRHEINIICQQATGIGDIQDRVYLDSTKFSGSCTYYFEFVADNTSAQIRTYILRNSNDGQEVAVNLTAEIHGYRRYRSASFTPNDTYPEKKIYSQNTGSTIIAARIIIIQDTSTDSLIDSEAQIEIGDYETSLFTSEATQALTYPKYWHYDSDKWDGNIEIFGEVTWQCINDREWLSVYIQEDNGCFADWTNVSTILSQGGNEAISRTRGSDFSSQLTSGRNYRLAIQTEGTKATYGVNIFNAKLIIRQNASEIKHEFENPNWTNIYGGSGSDSNIAGGQSFTTSGAISVTTIRIYLRKDGTPTDNYYMDITSGTIGGTVIGTSGDIAGSSVSSYGWVEFKFSTPVSLSASTMYFIRLWRDGSRDISNYLSWASEQAGTYSGGQRWYLSGGSWDTSNDFMFAIYADGEITKLEEQYLLLNTGTTSENQLLGYNSGYDADEWDAGSGTINIYPEHHVTDGTTDDSYSTGSQYDTLDGTPSAVGQSFTSQGGTLDSASFRTRFKTGNPTGNVYVKIYSHSGTYGSSSVPSSLLATSDARDASGLTENAEQFFTFSGTDRITLTSSSNYVMVIEHSNGQATAALQIYYDSAGSHGGNKCSYNGSWAANASSDLRFAVYTGADEETTVVQVDADSYLSGGTSAQRLWTSGAIEAGQSFKAPVAGKLLSIAFSMRKYGSPTGNATAYLYAHAGTFGSSGTPTGLALATSGTLDVSTLTTSYARTEFKFSTSYSLVLNTNYFITVYWNGGDGSNYIEMHYDGIGEHAGNVAAYVSSWNAYSGRDLVFWLSEISVENSSVVGGYRKRGGTALSMADDKEIDTYVIEAGS